MNLKGTNYSPEDQKRIQEIKERLKDSSLSGREKDEFGIELETIYEKYTTYTPEQQERLDSIKKRMEEILNELGASAATMDPDKPPMPELRGLAAESQQIKESARSSIAEAPKHFWE